MATPPGLGRGRRRGVGAIKVEGLDPAQVQLQHPFIDGSGRHRRIDFVLTLGDAKLAIEVDGYNKTGHGAMTRQEFDDFLARRNSIPWRLLQFSNDQITREPGVAARLIALEMREIQLEQRQRSLTTVEVDELRKLREVHSLERQAGPTPRQPHRAVKPALIGVAVAAVALVVTLVVIDRDTADQPGLAPTNGKCPTTHPIKGNINRDGEKIFHETSGDFYGATIPERCFESREAARQAGFRAPRR